MHQEADIIVVGAGLVGLSAALAFAQQGKSVVLVDEKKTHAKKAEDNKANTWDSRIYALTPATESWLQTLGVWQHVDAARVNDIHAMHLWNDDATSPLILADSDANLMKLGVIVENCNLMHALRANLDAASGLVLKTASCKSIENFAQHICLTLDDDTQVSAKLLVAADGAHSFVRQQLNIATKLKAFNQTAIVANFLAEKPHQDVARQWFAAHETLALLPLPEKHVSMVWSLSTERAAELLLLTPQQLAARVQARANYALGELELVSEVLSFELQQASASQLIAERVVLIGDAAHQIHPMAGQGVNLGFRDIAALQQLLAKAHALQDIGEKIFLRQYERARKADIVSMNSLTSGLDYLFASEQYFLKKLANWGMRQLNKQAIMKKIMIKQAAV